jgi:ankyrin repeat protein
MKHFPLILALLLGSSSLFAAPKCQEFFADANLSSSDLGGWSLEQYNELVDAMKNWDTEFSNGRKIDQLLSRPGINPEYHLEDGTSLFQLAAQKDHYGYLTARLLRAGLDPFKRYSNGKNALIEALEVEPSSDVILQIMTGDPGLTKINFKVPRKVLPYDFYAFKPDGSPDKEMIGQLENMKLVNDIFATAISTGNVPLVSYIMETYKLKNFLDDGKPKALIYLRGKPTPFFENKSILKLAIKSKSSELVQYLLEKQKLNPNEVLPGENALNSAKSLPLHYAITSRAPIRIVELLLASGANANQKDERGKTAMSRALEVEKAFGDSRYVQLLQAHGIKKPSFIKRVLFGIKKIGDHL